jgi:broad specificity phosphatase PhoE
VRFPGGESLQEVAVRAADTLRRVWREHRSGTVVLVGHEYGNRVLLLQALDQPLSSNWRIGQSPCAINEIDISEHEIRVQRLNETFHLILPLRV